MMSDDELKKHIEEKKAKQEADRQAWKKALDDYLAKEAKGMDYRTFLISSLLKEDIVVEQADWILERIGELPMMGHGCSCGGSCGCGSHGCCDKCQGECKNGSCECHK